MTTAPRDVVGGHDVTATEAERIIKEHVPDPDGDYTGILVGTVYPRPPRASEVVDPTHELSAEEIHRLVTAGKFEGLPIKLEHEPGAVRRGRIVSAHVEAPSGALKIHFRLRRNGNDAHEILSRVRNGDLAELSLGHIALNNGGGRVPVEVSLVRQGARKGSTIDANCRYVAASVSVLCTDATMATPAPAAPAATVVTAAATTPAPVPVEATAPIAEAAAVSAPAPAAAATASKPTAMETDDEVKGAPDAESQDAPQSKPPRGTRRPIGAAAQFSADFYARLTGIRGATADTSADMYSTQAAQNATQAPPSQSPAAPSAMQDVQATDAASALGKRPADAPSDQQAKRQEPAPAQQAPAQVPAPAQAAAPAPVAAASAAPAANAAQQPTVQQPVATQQQQAPQPQPPPVQQAPVQQQQQQPQQQAPVQQQQQPQQPVIPTPQVPGMQGMIIPPQMPFPYMNPYAYQQMFMGGIPTGFQNPYAFPGMQMPPVPFQQQPQQQQQQQQPAAPQVPVSQGVPQPQTPAAAAQNLSQEQAQRAAGSTYMQQGFEQIKQHFMQEAARGDRESAELAERLHAYNARMAAQGPSVVVQASAQPQPQVQYQRPAHPMMAESLIPVTVAPTGAPPAQAPAASTVAPTGGYFAKAGVSTTLVSQDGPAKRLLSQNPLADAQGVVRQYTELACGRMAVDFENNMRRQGIQFRYSPNIVADASRPPPNGVLVQASARARPDQNPLAVFLYENLMEMADELSKLPDEFPVVKSTGFDPRTKRALFD